MRRCLIAGAPVTDTTTNLSFSRSTEFTDIGKAKIDMPPEVKKLFED